MEKKKYNGWTNYETWKVNLEMGISDNEHMANWDAEAIEEWAYEYVNEESTGIANDLARSVLREVNWEEISQHLREAYGICRTCNEETEEEYCEECEKEFNALPFIEKG